MKKIIISGAGEVGFHLAKWLSEENQEVTIIDLDNEKLTRIKDQIDVQTIQGSSISAQVLKEAGAENTDILISVTDSDETNMITSLVGSGHFNIPSKVARIRNQEFLNDKLILGPNYLNIDLVISPEKEVADHILKIMQIPGAIDVISFENDRILLIGYKINEKSPLLNMSLKNIKQKVLIISIVRDDKVIIPKGHDVILNNDKIFILTKREELSQIQSLLKKEESIKRIMIIGASQISFNLAQSLENKGIEVKLVDSQKIKCYEMSEKLNKTIILHGDPTDINLLKEENIQDIDVFVGASNDEGVNLLSSLLAKRFGVKKTIAIVNNYSYIPVSSSIGIDVVLSPKLIAASRILHFVREGVLTIKTLSDIKAEAFEIIAKPDWDIINKPLSTIKFPQETLIGAIIRNEEIIIPTGKDFIYPNDRVIIFALVKALKKIEKILKVDFDKRSNIKTG